MRMPFDGSYRITSTWQDHINEGGTRAQFAGTDWGLPIGTLLKAVESGTIYTFKDNKVKDNNGVWHDGALCSRLTSMDSKRVWLYVHLNDFMITKGFVNEGDNIAHSGNTGWVIGAHLHLTLLDNGKNIDPMRYLNLVNNPMFRAGQIVEVMGRADLFDDYNDASTGRNQVEVGAVGVVINNDIVKGFGGNQFVDTKWYCKDPKKQDHGWISTGSIRPIYKDRTYNDGSVYNPTAKQDALIIELNKQIEELKKLTPVSKPTRVKTVSEESIKLNLIEKIVSFIKRQ